MLLKRGEVEIKFSIQMIQKFTNRRGEEHQWFRRLVCIEGKCLLAVN